MNYKAIIFDVDGTLINKFDGKISNMVIKAVKKAKKKIHISIATGRPRHAVEKIIKDLDLDGLAILCDGAQIINLRTNEVLFQQEIEKEDFLKTLKIIKKFNCEYCILDDNRDISYKEKYTYKTPLSVFSFNLSDKLADNLIKELSILSNISIYKIHKWGDQEKAGVVVSHIKATKQHAILEYSKLLGINTHEIIGVGDSYNDFPMFMACGLRIAMGNAINELKEIADYIAPSVDEDGVVKVIEKFIL